MKNIIEKGKEYFLKNLKEFDFLDFIKKNKFYVILVLSAFFTGVYFECELMEALVFAIFISSIIRPVDSRIFASVGLFFLVLTPIVLYSGDKKTAETIAVYAFYFLVMTVMMAFVEMKKEEKGV